MYSAIYCTAQLPRTGICMLIEEANDVVVQDRVVDNDDKREASVSSVVNG